MQTGLANRDSKQSLFLGACLQGGGNAGFKIIPLPVPERGRLSIVICLRVSARNNGHYIA